MTFNAYTKPGTTDQRYKYNDGAERENVFDLGIDYTAFRNYDPSLGRWWQIDEIEKVHEYGYAWVTNNPIRFNDPLGLDRVQHNDPDVDFDEDVVLLDPIELEGEDVSYKLVDDFNKSPNIQYIRKMYGDKPQATGAVAES